MGAHNGHPFIIVCFSELLGFGQVSLASLLLDDGTPEHKKCNNDDKEKDRYARDRYKDFTKPSPSGLLLGIDFDVRSFRRDIHR